MTATKVWRGLARIPRTASLLHFSDILPPSLTSCKIAWLIGETHRARHCVYCAGAGTRLVRRPLCLDASEYGFIRLMEDRAPGLPHHRKCHRHRAIADQ